LYFGLVNFLFFPTKNQYLKKNKKKKKKKKEKKKRKKKTNLGLSHREPY
jgi:hypothetical protein